MRPARPRLRRCGRWRPVVRGPRVGDVRAALRALGCESEGSDVPCLIAVDVPPDVRYSDVRALLEKLLAEGVLDYEEACLGQVDTHVVGENQKA